MDYRQFLESKKTIVKSSGFEVDKSKLNSKLFEWQKDIVHWALKKGKAALFEDCGLGKTPLRWNYGKGTQALYGLILIKAIAGIGSEIYQAVKMGRRGIGIELKESYYEQAVKNCIRAEEEANQVTLLDILEGEHGRQ